MRATLLAFLLLKSLLASPLPDEGKGYQEIERFIEILEAVRERHPDTDKVTYERLVNHALEGMLSSLDPRSAFYHPDAAQALKASELNPTVDSLGLTLSSRQAGQVSILNVIKHSSAEKAGLSAGDVLLSIDQVKTTTLIDSLKLLDRLPGQKVTLQLRKENALLPYEVELVHKVIHSQPVSEATLLADKTTGFIRLNQFTNTAAHDLEAALDDLEDQGMKTLILDLRGNPGGLLEVCTKIIGLFVPPNTVVVTTRGRDLEEKLKTPARQRKKRSYPLVVLIDRDSASASELTAGALQDLKRATIIGETSYGKGSVQNIIPMASGTALRLTIAKYHTPSGKTPHLVGVTPDRAITPTDTDRKNFELWLQRQTINPHFTQQLKSWNDPWMAEATKSLATTK
nr:carboxy-terminal-processing protease-like [Nerophis lumbriciformis]